MAKRFNPRSKKSSNRKSGSSYVSEDRDILGVEREGFGFEEEEEEDTDDDHSADEESLLEDESGDDFRGEEGHESVDATEDPVRMYLMQMGEIPLLTRQEEVSAAKRIELTRTAYRQWMLASDFMLQGATKLLEQVRDSKLRLDRTIEVSVTNASEKIAIMRRIGPNIKTLRHLLLRNHGDYFAAINKSLPLSERRQAWKRLVCRRNKAVRLIEEMNLRTNRLEPIFQKIECNPWSDGSIARTHRRRAGHGFFGWYADRQVESRIVLLNENYLRNPEDFGSTMPASPDTSLAIRCSQA